MAAEEIIDDMQRADARLVEAATQFNGSPLTYVVESAWGGFSRVPDFIGDDVARAVIGSLERQIREYPEYVEAMKQQEQEASENDDHPTSGRYPEVPETSTLCW